MSSRKRTRRTAVVEEEEEEVKEVVTTHRGSSERDDEWSTSIQKINQLTQLTNEELEEIDQAQNLQQVTQEERDVLVSEMVRHIVFKNHSKNGVPISHAELTDLVNSKKNTTNARKGLSKLIIKLAQAKLLEVFGMELREIHRVSGASKTGPKARATANERSGTVWYVLRSTLPESLRLSLVQGPIHKEIFNAFAMTVLTCLHLKGSEGLMEVDIWRLLKSGTGVDDKTELPNNETGADLLKRMEAMRYIIKEKVTAPEEGLKYTMAENALDELGSGSDGILKFLSQFTDAEEE